MGFMLPVTPEPSSLQSKIEEFLAYCAARNLSPHTVKGYRHDLQDLAAHAGAQALNRKLLRSFLVSLHLKGLAASSIQRHLAAVKSFSKWLDSADDRFIRSIPGPRRADKLPDVPSEADMQQLLDGGIPSPHPERDRLILELLYGSGLRVSELVGINLADFQDRRVLLVRGKGKKERLVVFGEYAQRALDAWLPIRESFVKEYNLATDALLFSLSNNQSIERLDVRSVGRILKAIATAKGLPAYNPHALRHACGTHMHDHGAPLQMVATFLGHSRLSTAQIYTRVSTGRMLDVYRGAHPDAAN